MRLVKWHQVPSYYDTVLCNNSRLLHSTVKKKKKKKKWQTRHQVPRCWPHSTVCRSPGHGIWSTWANGDIPMYIWPDNRNTGRFLEPPFRSQEPFPLPETEVTSSKMAGGSGNGSWLLNGGSKNLPILLTCLGWLCQIHVRYSQRTISRHFSGYIFCHANPYIAKTWSLYWNSPKMSRTWLQSTAIQLSSLIHRGRVKHLYVIELTDDKPNVNQSQCWPYIVNRKSGINSVKFVITIADFSFEKMHFRGSSAKWPPFDQVC